MIEVSSQEEDSDNHGKLSYGGVNQDEIVIWPKELKAKLLLIGILLILGVLLILGFHINLHK